MTQNILFQMMLQRLRSIVFDLFYSEKCGDPENCGCCQFGHYHCWRLNSVKGKLIIEFEPNEEEATEEIFDKGLGFGKPYGKVEDFSIISKENKEYKFNRDALMEIEYFQPLLERCNFRESQENQLIFKDVSSDTIEVFKKALYNDVVKKEELTVDLYMFADMVGYLPLRELCSVQIGKNITKENLLKITDAAYIRNDDNLLREVAKFLDTNRGRLLSNFLRKNRKYSSKILELMSEVNSSSSESESDSDLD